MRVAGEAVPLGFGKFGRTGRQHLGVGRLLLDELAVDRVEQHHCGQFDAASVGVAEIAAVELRREPSRPSAAA